MPKFDKAYYDRFYRDPHTRSSTPQAAKKQAAFIAAYLRYLGVRIRSIIDIGCGVGHTLRALGRIYPNARCEGVEYSDYLCREYGWTQGSVAACAPATQADLVVCNDVVAYLEDDEAAIALKNLAQMSNRALFFGALTTEDWRMCDKQRTDRRQIQRPGVWYSKRIFEHFEPVGGGLYLKKPVGMVIWTLDGARQTPVK